MMCGTPVVGTDWGGLRDTIIDDSTGFKVRTIVSCVGVKVDWWQAATRIINLLRNPGILRELGEKARRIAGETYSLQKYRTSLNRLLTRSLEMPRERRVSLATTAFGSQHLAAWTGSLGSPPPYGWDAPSLELYRELASPMASAQSVTSGIGADGALLVLPSPTKQLADKHLSIDDPLYPLSVQVPPEMESSVTFILQKMNVSPVVRERDLFSGADIDHGELKHALGWLVETGILLRSSADESDSVDEHVSAELCKPHFIVHRVHHSADVAYIA